MADKAITDLNVVPGTIDDGNTWFAVAQSGAAYKVSGHEFILALTSILDGHGGIKTITYTDPVAPSLTGTLTITLADDTTTSLSIQNGKGITSIAKTGTSGLVDTYTITYNDSTTSTFSVTNGAKGDTGDSWYVWIRYAGSQPTQDSDIGTDPDNWIGIYSGTSSTAPTHYTDYDWFKIKGEQGAKGDPATIVSQSVTYQGGEFPNVPPTDQWSPTIPVVEQGNYLWTRTVVQFNSGNPITFYSVARMGLDGSGSVSSVNGQSPSATGNVTVTASDIQTTDSTSVQSDLTGLKTALNQTNQNIAFVETSNTASRTYIKGTFICWNSSIYRASATIQNGASFNVGTNLETVTGGGLNNVFSPISVTATAASGFSLESWGSITVSIIGSLIVVNVNGLRSVNAVSSDTTCINMSNLSFVQTGAVAAGTVWQNSGNGHGLVNVYSSAVHVNNIDANTVISFQVVIPTLSISIS